MNPERLNAGSALRGTTGSPVPILLVDDSANKRFALRSILAPLGYSIVEADSGLAALRCVMAQAFAVILLDVRMPEMDGLETAALIRQRKQSEMTPIIFITAYGKNEIANIDRYAQGAVDFIFAPVPPDELRAKVSVFARLFQKAEELAARAREVQASADQLRLLTEAAPIGIFQTDADNRYVYTNPRWSEITGLRPEEAAGRAWDIIVSADQQSGLVAGPADGPAGGGEICRRFRMQHTGSSSRILLVTSRSIPNSEGGTAGWVGTLADVTAEAGAEAAMSQARDEATEGSRLKSDFLANMSHEIRTPMNGVIGMTELLLETDLDARQRDYAQTVRSSGEALLTIIEDILDFSRVEAGKLKIEEVEFDPRTSVEDVVDLLARRAQAKDLELVVVIEESVPAMVSGDPGRVRQVLTNLLGNAVKFTQTGEIVVRVKGQSVGERSFVYFEVSDTGDGIEADQLDAIFEPFVQADTSTSRRYGGTGLGLAISSQLVSLMGGDCGVFSRKGLGSTFWFTIEVQTDSGQRAQIATPDAGDLSGVTALIVDDNATQREVLSEYLKKWGMVVTTAESGRAALGAIHIAAVLNHPYAVVLIDKAMPGMSGLELRDAVLADAKLSTRLILMSGQGDDVEPVSTGDSGVCGTLFKPVHQERLRASLRVALGLQPATVLTTDSTGQSPPVESGTQKGRLLLAEDNLVNQTVAVAFLSQAGYQVDTALNGALAVMASSQQTYDAILMDCQMPEMNGYEATAAIRALEGSIRHTPIIALTAGARAEDRERCLAEGMDDYLSKPLNKAALLSLVAGWVNAGPAGALNRSR